MDYSKQNDLIMKLNSRPRDTLQAHKEMKDQEEYATTRKVSLVTQIEESQVELDDAKIEHELAGRELVGVDIRHTLNRARQVTTVRDQKKRELGKMRAMRRDAEHAMLQHIEDITRQNKVWESMQQNLSSLRQDRIVLEDQLKEEKAWRQPPEIRARCRSISPLPNRDRVDLLLHSARDNTHSQQRRAQILENSLSEARLSQ